MTLIIIIFLFYFPIINASLNKNARSQKHKNDLFLYKADADDALQAQIKSRILQRARIREDRLNNGRDIPPFRSEPEENKYRKEYFHMDPVLNHLKRRAGLQNKELEYNSVSGFSSSSSDEQDWKAEFNEARMMKKMHVINSTSFTSDTYLAGARPWGIPCGDRQQSRIPWGNCVLKGECEGEFRIYRGDSACGRDSFICCAVQVINYDLYQGFDVSFMDSESSTGDEKKKGSREKRMRHRFYEKRKRQKLKKRRMRAIKKSIRRVVREIRKILNRSYRNSSRYKTSRMRFLMNFIKGLKEQYKEERKDVKNIHDLDVNEINSALEKRLREIRDVNFEFLMNQTFRKIVMNRNYSRAGALGLFMLDNPEAVAVLNETMIRRQDGGDPDMGIDKEGKSYDEIEYTLYIKQ